MKQFRNIMGVYFSSEQVKVNWITELFTASVNVLTLMSQPCSYNRLQTFELWPIWNTFIELFQHLQTFFGWCIKLVLRTTRVVLTAITVFCFTVFVQLGQPRQTQHGRSQSRVCVPLPHELLYVVEQKLAYFQQKRSTRYFVLIFYFFFCFALKHFQYSIRGSLNMAYNWSLKSD